MVLGAKAQVTYSEIQGRRVPDGESIESQEDEKFPPAKRLKPFKANDQEDDRDPSDQHSIPQSPKNLVCLRAETPDSVEGDICDDESFAPHATGLESTLPPMKMEKVAIEEYEALRASQDIPEDLRSRLTKTNSKVGKSSIYVDAFNFALETVLENEGHLFDEKEFEVFKQWRALEYETQALYVRLFLRKTSAWHRLNRLGYYSDITDLPAAVKSLQSTRMLPEPSLLTQAYPYELSIPEGTELTSTFTFADCSDEMITTMEEASSLLNLEELKLIAKKAKVKGKNKADLLKALRNMSKHQSGLSWAGFKRSDNGLDIISESEGNEDLDNQRLNANRDNHFLQNIMASTGACIRLSIPPLRLFERVHLVFYRSTEWTDKSLTTIILARVSQQKFPSYIVSRSANIFPSRFDLLEYEAALRAQFYVDNMLEMNGNSDQARPEKVLAIFDQVYPRWKVLLSQEERKEDRIYDSGEGAYLRRFSPAWVYTRILHKGTYVLARFKQYNREYSVTTELLDQHLFHVARRGAWYQRKAILEEHYMYKIRPPPGSSDVEQQKKYWKRIALQTCEAGLQDRDCHQIYHYDLQKRIEKLERKLKIPKREQHDFGHVLLSQPVEVTVDGIQIVKRHKSKRPINSASQEKQRNNRTIWLDEPGGSSECSVEAMCLSSYRSRGYKGYHAEGGIIRTLFAYLFYDILFMYIPNVFQTAYQTCPLDLHTDAFFPARLSEINHRLAEIENGSAADMIRAVDAREREKRTCIVGLNWDFEFLDLLEIVQCFDGPSLAMVCKVMAQEYRIRGGGMPDLFLWHVTKKEVLFSEVKSQNDRLSDTQRLWIHVLTACGIRVELCNAVAREVRVITAL